MYLYHTLCSVAEDHDVCSIITALSDQQPLACAFELDVCWCPKQRVIDVTQCTAISPRVPRHPD